MLLLPLAGGTLLHAQTSSTGALGGVVRDPSGAAIPETRVTLESIGTGLSSTLTSDRLGEFFFPELAPGSYRVRIQAAGFDPLRISGEEVVLGRTTRMAPSLRIGGVTQAVSVETADDLPLFDSPVNGNLQPSELQALHWMADDSRAWHR